MNAPSEDIKDMLIEDSSLGLTFATNLFKSKEPKTPRNCVTIYDTPGLGSDPKLDPAEGDYERPGLQIRVRNYDYDAGMTLAQSIKELLHCRAQESRNGAFYTSIVCVNGPTHIGYDDNNNALIVLNFNLQRR
jgi:hypothetical protein